MLSKPWQSCFNSGATDDADGDGEALLLAGTASNSEHATISTQNVAPAPAVSPGSSVCELQENWPTALTASRSPHWLTPHASVHVKQQLSKVKKLTRNTSQEQRGQAPTKS